VAGNSPLKEGKEHPHPFPPPSEGEDEGGGRKIKSLHIERESRKSAR